MPVLRTGTKPDKNNRGRTQSSPLLMPYAYYPP
jgi:hypothetical protein